ncbi:MAG: T9SS type A sorting domain-containing protein [Candidatus Eisenbacteria bacterium]|nr:T9SS type A sorting domain-containing protein [Candidatus Eisenbacteria bacterium]
MHARHRSFAKRYLVFLALGVVVSAGFVSRALAAWSGTPVPVATSPGAQTGPLLVPGGAGGLTIAWTDRRDTSGVWANRVDSTGNAASATGFPVGPPDSSVQGLAAASDGAGGMLLAWSDQRTSPRSIWAQHIGTTGTHLWTVTGVRVATGAGAQTAPAVASDGAGGLYVAWEDQRNGNADIYAQHILANGTVAWAAAGVPLCTSSGEQTSPRIAADGRGGAVVLWDDTRNAPTPASQVYLQRVNAAGNVRFTADGLSVDGNSSTVRGRLSCDAGANTTVIFADTVGSGASYGIFAQRFDSTGSSRYTGNNRVQLSTSANPLWPVAVFSRANGEGLFVFGSPTDVRARALGSTGSNVWGNSGGLVLTTPAPAAAADISAISDGADGAWVTWTDGELVQTQHVVSGGTLPLGAAPLLVSTDFTRTSGAAAALMLANGDLAVAWEDADTGGSPDTGLVVQRIGPNGIRGAYFRIVVGATTNGSLTPGPALQFVASQDSLRFVATSSGGHHVQSLLVDGVDVGPLPNWTFHQVAAHHTIGATFSNQVITQRTITAPDVFVPLSFPFVFSNDAPATVLASLFPPDPTRWRFGRWDPTFKHYDVPPDSLNHLSAGHGYWFATKVADTLDTSGAANPESDFTLSLTPVHAESTGWNQIGQPFRFPVAVSALRVRSGAGSFESLISPAQVRTGKQVFGWDPVNGYTAVTSLQPGRSYWVHKESGANISLRYLFEYSQTLFSPGTLAQLAPAPVPTPGAWAVRLDLTQPAAPAAHLQLGTAQGDGAARSYARLPDSPGASPALWTVADGAEWSAHYGDDAQQLEWNVYVRGGGALAQGALEVAFDGVPEGREVTLSDPAAGWTRVLQGGEDVALALGAEPRRLVVRVAASGAVAPAGVATLRALAPNPFAESTALSFVLPVAGDLDAQVYDVGGRRVATLSRRGLSAGEHVIQWNGRDGSGVRVRPGVYLLRWSAGGQSGAARIVSLQ